MLVYALGKKTLYIDFRNICIRFIGLFFSSIISIALMICIEIACIVIGKICVIANICNKKVMTEV